jgi:hypothetical protein
MARNHLLIQTSKEGAIGISGRSRGASESASRIAHVLGFGDFALDVLPIAMRHVAAVRPSFAKSRYLAGTREPASAAAFERAAHRAREVFNRCSDYRAGLCRLGCSSDRATHRVLRLDARDQLRVVSFKSLETISDYADSCF